MKQSFLTRSCAVIALVLAACQYDPFAYTYTRRQPELADLAGEYWLADQNLDGSLDRVLRTEATGPCGHCSLTLQPDGTFVALDFPVWSETPAGYELRSFDTFTGSWSLETVGSVDDGVTLTPVWGLRFDADGRQTVWAHLAGESPPYTIHFGFGDPDAGEAMRYRSNASTAETGEPDFTIVSAFFLLLFAAVAFVALVIAIGLVLLALAAVAAIVCGVVLLGCALLALLALAAVAAVAGGCFLVLALGAAVLAFAVRRARAAKPPSASAR